MKRFGIFASRYGWKYCVLPVIAQQPRPPQRPARQSLQRSTRAGSRPQHPHISQLPDSNGQYQSKIS